MPWYFANLVCTLFLRWKKPLRPSNLFITANHWQWIHVECPRYWSTSKQLKWRTHSQECRQVFTLGFFFFLVISAQQMLRDRSEEAAAHLPPQGREGWMYLSLLECSLAISLRFCLSHSRRALSCSSLCLFLRSCSRSFSFTLACFP